MTDEEKGARSKEPLNYFNYFTEVEEEFVRRRGKPLLVSPMDWALIESWKTAGIPLHIVLRAINQAFDSYDARARKHRKVNSIFYCQQEVETEFADYRLSQVGAGPESAPEPVKAEAAHLRKANGSKSQAINAFSKEMLLDYLSRSDGELEATARAAVERGRNEITDAVTRARGRLKELASEIEASARVDEEALERDLDAIARLIRQSLISSMGEAELKQIRDEAESQLQSYRRKMDKAIYDQTIENFISRRLHEINHAPRLSLFYI